MPKFINLATGLWLDSSSDKRVYPGTCNTGLFQNWLIDNMRLKDQSTGLCLDSSTDKRVYTGDCNGGPFQNWIINQPQTYLIKDQATGLCLDNNPQGDAYTDNCNGVAFQNWYQQGDDLLDNITQFVDITDYSTL